MSYNHPHLPITATSPQRSVSSVPGQGGRFGEVRLNHQIPLRPMQHAITTGYPNTLKQVNMLMKWDWLLLSGKNYAAKGKYVLLTALGHHKWNGYERFTPWKTFKFHYHYPVNSFLICLCRLMFHNFHNTQTVHWLSFKHAWYHQYSDCKSNIQRATYLLP